jgi:hypothetical protein
VSADARGNARAGRGVGADMDRAWVVGVLAVSGCLAHPGHELHRLYGDRDTGVVVAVLGTCAGESCTCDPRFVAELLRWDDATFEAVERRPCAAREGGPACGAYDFFGVLDAARAPWT